MSKCCSDACPAALTELSERICNYGCLPDLYEINIMKRENKIWMCHQNNKKPCVATGLNKLPEKAIPVTEETW